MFESAFERRVKDLARRADLKISDLSSSRGQADFQRWRPFSTPLHHPLREHLGVLLPQYHCRGRR